MEQLQYRLQRDNEVTKERVEKAIAERYRLFLVRLCGLVEDDFTSHDRLDGCQGSAPDYQNRHAFVLYVWRVIPAKIRPDDVVVLKRF